MGMAILIVEDDTSFVEFLSRYLEKEGHEAEHASTGEEGLRLFREKTPDLVLLDLVLPSMDGMQVLEQMKQQDESAGVIVMTAHGSITTAVEAMRLGALDYITKPIDLEALDLKLAQARKLLGMRSDLDYLLDRERRSGATAGVSPGVCAEFENFIGTSPKMRLVYEKIREVAKTDNTTVLVTSQSCTGKELASRAIHTLSARGAKPLMQIDCTSIPFSLMESELFGHERGAFTGADRVKKGLLELADRGTLLLDEIGDMDLTLQGKLLRVLQERQFRRVGGTRDLSFDVRVIAATNQDLDHLSTDGRFRRDLLYRLKVFQIELPPLKDRGDDVLELAEAFISIYARSFRKPVQGLEDQARHLLKGYSFPGNVRELRNMIEQAVILSRGELITHDQLSIPQTAADSPVEVKDGDSTGLSLEQLGEKPLLAAERELLRQALRKSGGNKKQAAELLGISRFALQRKLEKLVLDQLEEKE